MIDTTDQKLQDILRAVLDLDPAIDATCVRQQGFAAWDSLAHVTIVAALESEFGVNVDAADSMQLTSYAAIRRYLQQQGR